MAIVWVQEDEVLRVFAGTPVLMNELYVIVRKIENKCADLLGLIII